MKPPKTSANEPLVSIGVCTHSRPEGLRETLTCLTRQTYKNLQIIVSQDLHPSLDMTDIVSSFRDGRITFYRQAQQLFMNGNFAFVLEKALGDFFMWAADDDLWAEDFVDECLKYFSEPSVMMVAPSGEFIDGDQIKHEWPRNPGFALPAGPGNFIKFLSASFTENVGFYGLYRTSTLKAVGLRNAFGSDQHLLGALLLQGAIVQTERSVFKYRTNGSSGDMRRYLRALGLTRWWQAHFLVSRFLLDYQRIVWGAKIPLCQKPQLAWQTLIALLRVGVVRYAIKRELTTFIKAVIRRD